MNKKRLDKYKKPYSEKEFEKNFSPIKPPMTETEAFYESARCLFCHDAPCVNACPTHIDIPLFIRHINTGNVIASAKTIYDSNWLGHACGQVCPTEVLCEGACVYNNQHEKPIDIGRLQAFATGKAIADKKKLYSSGKPNGRKVAVIGAGPAGISCACELRLLGYETDIYEAKDKPSGLTVYGVAPYKITNEAALQEMDFLQKMFGLNIHYNHPIMTRDDLDKLEKTHDAIFIGIGLGETSSPAIPGEHKENCIGAVEFIEELRVKHHKVWVGKKVIVIGGGNTAMDAASESCRMGAKSVIIAYRRSKEEMGAYQFEYDLSSGSGARGLFNVTPMEITGNKRVEGVKFLRNRSAYGKIENIHGSEFTEPCDMVIFATGQEKKVEFLEQIRNIKLDVKGRILDNRGRIIVNKNFQTNNPKYFAAGDAVNGGVEVVNAVAEGKMAARGIHEYLSESRKKVVLPEINPTKQSKKSTSRQKVKKYVMKNPNV